MDAMPLDLRLEANSLIDRLVADHGDTFDRAEATRLLQLIPAQPKSRWFGLEVRGFRSGGSHQGMAAGAGQVSVPGEDQSFEFTIDGDVLWRIGGYKVTHRTGELAIGLMMDVDPLNSRRCFLIYSDAAAPLRLDVQVNRALTIPLGFGEFVLSLPGRRVWKRPATDRGLMR